MFARTASQRNLVLKEQNKAKKNKNNPPQKNPKSKQTNKKGLWLT